MSYSEGLPIPQNDRLENARSYLEESKENIGDSALIEKLSDARNYLENCQEARAGLGAGMAISSLAPLTFAYQSAKEGEGEAALVSAAIGAYTLKKSGDLAAPMAKRVASDLAAHYLTED